MPQKKEAEPNLMRKANKHHLPHWHPDRFLFFGVWPWNNEAGLTFIICIQRAVVGSRNCSSTSLRNKRGWDTCGIIGSLLSAPLNGAQNFDQIQAPRVLLSCFKLVNKDLRAGWVNNTLGLHSAASWLRGCRTGSSHPWDPIKIRLLHPPQMAQGRLQCHQPSQGTAATSLHPTSTSPTGPKLGGCTQTLHKITAVSLSAKADAPPGNGKIVLRFHQGP